MVLYLLTHTEPYIHKLTVGLLFKILYLILISILVPTGGVHKRIIVLKVNKVNLTAFKNQTVIAKIASQLSTVTNKSEGLSSGNLNASVMMIKQLADLRTDSTINANAMEIKVQLLTLNAVYYYGTSLTVLVYLGEVCFSTPGTRGCSSLRSI